MIRRLMVRMFFSGLRMLVGLGVFWLLLAWWSERQGVKKTEALLQGDESVRLDSFEVEYQQRRVRCTDPESLRYLERCFRENSPTRFDDRITYEVFLQFADGTRLGIRTDWSRAGFSLCMPGDRLLQDGGEPRAYVVFRPPMREPIKEMIDFLNDDSRKAKGVVLIMEGGTIRREADPSLIYP
jgi:hypothetical protein